MAQLFPPHANAVIRSSILAALVSIAGVAGLAFYHVRSASYWNIGEPAPQPIPFRHDLHAGQLAVDCRFCHSSVERSAQAGMPSAHTCLTCHSQVWQGAGVLEPLRTSIALDQPIRWSSVHRLPDFAYFNHAAHVAKGVACETCHGRVDRMAETVKTASLSMGWCLDCHRDPTPHVRPKEAVFAFGWAGQGGRQIASRPPDPEASGTPRLMSCNICHR